MKYCASFSQLAPIVPEICAAFALFGRCGSSCDFDSWFDCGEVGAYNGPCYGSTDGRLALYGPWKYQPVQLFYHPAS